MSNGTPSIVSISPTPRLVRSARAVKENLLANKASMTARRPTRGIVLKENTFATMQVVTGNGEFVTLVDAGSKQSTPNGKALTGDGYRGTTVYTNFLLQHVIDAREEKAQILETFGEPYAFFFGERPQILQFQGVLMNSWDFNWEAEWWFNYDNYLRGTKCVEHDCQVYISFDNQLVSGYILSASSVKSAKDPNWVEFQFRLFVTSHQSLDDPQLGNPYAMQGLQLKQKNMRMNIPGTSLYGDASQYGFVATFTGDELAPFGPALYPSNNYNQRLVMTNDGSVKRVSLGGEYVVRQQYSKYVRMAQDVQAFSDLASPGSLATAWAKVSSTLNMIISTANQVMAGEVMKIPQGFEGVFAYDETSELNQALIRQDRINRGGVVEYTTFSDNWDEYVGDTTTPIVSMGAAGGQLSDGTLGEQLSYGQFKSMEVQKYFASAGLLPLGKAAEALATAVKAVKLGAVAVNLAKSIATFNPNSGGVRDSGFTNEGGRLVHLQSPSKER